MKIPYVLYIVIYYVNENGSNIEPINIHRSALNNYAN